MGWNGTQNLPVIGNLLYKTWGKRSGSGIWEEKYIVCYMGTGIATEIGNDLQTWAIFGMEFRMEAGKETVLDNEKSINWETVLGTIGWNGTQNQPVIGNLV